MRKAPLAVVFDNFQDAASPAFREMIANVLEAIPEGIHVVILSRYEPPTELSRLRANNKMTVVLLDDLSFTLAKCCAFLKARGNGTMPEETIRGLHEKTEGWAAGLVLMTEMTKTNTVDYSMISELSREAVFGYFAAEIFDKTSEEIRDFLLKTSFLPSMSAEAAGELTGSPDAHSILSQLSRAHYFTEWRPLPKPLPEGLVFGPDGNLYVPNVNGAKVVRFDGATGAFIDNFVAPMAPQSLLSQVHKVHACIHHTVADRPVKHNLLPQSHGVGS
jgi:hypothetical protein